jgi:hypothetical protein
MPPIVAALAAPTTFNEDTMIPIRRTLPGLLAALALSACGSVAEAPAEAQKPAGESVTGSNIPRRSGGAANGVQTISGEALQRGTVSGTSPR